MKLLVVVISTLLLGTLAHASSKYAGEYYAISKDYNPLKTGPKIVAGMNITVHENGSVTGKGASLDFTPITVTGKVKDSGEMTLVETSDGHRTKEEPWFSTGGKEFFLALPNGFVIGGEKISKKFPEAGVYHVAAETGEEAIFFLRRDGSVHGIVFDASGGLFDVDGEATTEGFSAMSDDGATFEGKFDGTEVSGAYSPNELEPLAIPFSGARY
jgi:hypothetical protein